MMLRRAFLRFAAVAILTPALDWTFRKPGARWLIETGHYVIEYDAGYSADVRTFTFDFTIEATP